MFIAETTSNLPASRHLYPYRVGGNNTYVSMLAHPTRPER